MMWWTPPAPDEVPFAWRRALHGIGLMLGICPLAAAPVINMLGEPHVMVEQGISE
jgi:hypothetical protein